MKEKLNLAPEIGVSIQALLDAGIEKPMFGRIEVENDDSGKVVNYCDLYNEDGELACMDGEVCTVDQVGNVLVTFRNDNGESTIYFALTKEEADIAAPDWRN